MTSLSSGRVATITPSVGSAGTSSSADSHSGGGTTISTTPEPKSSANLQSESRTDIHYPAINVHPSKMYESKKNKKIVRLMTVLAYMFTVSLVAMVLSLYYLFLWDPYMQPPNNHSFESHSTRTEMKNSNFTDDVENKDNTAQKNLMQSLLSAARNGESTGKLHEFTNAKKEAINRASGQEVKSSAVPAVLNETILPANQTHSSIASFLIPGKENRTQSLSDGIIIEVGNETETELIKTANDVYRVEMNLEDRRHTTLSVVDRFLNYTLGVSSVSNRSDTDSMIPP
ncbi:hypothetical protein B4U80_04471 [Leptotrombidium deliense]|uniref:Uncharacterized protein n=1 Tax=Leptotrombidium deliense TaxID=299467 RepID=A0A443STD6_9ACAR|nr:hypothetical protein B4U80_04471 [Leptotrombidium deliense]